MTSITNNSPRNNSTVSLMRADWQELFFERRKKVVPPGETLDFKDNKGFPAPVIFKWTAKNPGPFTLELSQQPDLSVIERTISTEESQVKVYNLFSGKNYYWRVTSQTERSCISAFTTKAGEIRQIFVSPSGPVNVRDWGGKTLPNGRCTKQGIIYRGTQMEDPFSLTEDACSVLRDELHIHTDLDLRYEEQVANMTESPLGPDVQWLHYAINAYNSFEPQNKASQFPLWRDTLRVFADKSNFPVYFHCFGGVDRTGEVALLLNFLLGVDEEQAFFDYEFSSMAYFPRMRTIPYLQQWLKDISQFDTSPDATLQSKTEKYMLTLGLTKEEIAAIRANLTE